MSNLDYIEQLGIGTDLEVSDTEAETNEPNDKSEEDLSLNSEGETSEKTDEPSTEQVNLMESLQKQIEGMEKRISDKDAYINELKELSKQKDEPESSEVDTEEKTFWDDPDDVIAKLEARAQAQDEKLHMQDLLIKEQVYSHTVEDYWKTVNPEALNNAVATDAKFSEEFNVSGEPYKFAYEYLTNKSKSDADSSAKLREQIKAEVIAEMGIKESKEAPPSLSVGKSSGQSGVESGEDGFASVFGIN